MIAEQEWVPPTPFTLPEFVDEVVRRAKPSAKSKCDGCGAASSCALKKALASA